MIQTLKVKLKKLSQTITSDKGEQEIVQYGLYQCFWIIFSLLSVFFLGVLWQEVVFGLILFFNLFFLRPYTGGYHADTEWRCYFISIGVINLAIMGRKFLEIPETLRVCSFIGAFLLIWINAPIENPEKLLDSDEIQRYSKKVKQIIILFTLIELIGVVLQEENLKEGILYGMIIAAVSVFVGKEKYIIRKRGKSI